MAEPLDLPDVDPARLLAALRRGSDCPELELAEPPQLLAVGGEARVDAFRLAGAPAGPWTGPLVLRRMLPFKDPGTVRWEAAVHGALVEQGFPVPRVLLAEESPGVLGAAFLVAERIPGRMLLEQVLRPASLVSRPLRIPGLVREALTLVPRCLGETQARMHALDPEPLGRALRAAGFEPDAIRFEGRLAELAARAERAGLGGLAPGLEWLQAVRTQGAPEVVCHGDFVFTNLCVEAGRVTGVFDWSKVALAEPEYDVAASLARLQSTVPGVPRLLGLLFETVQSSLARRYLSCYERARALDPERLRLYEGFWILHELVWGGERLVAGARFDGAIEQRWLHPDAIDAGVRRFAELSGVRIEARHPAS